MNSEKPTRVGVYIDGFNLYFGMRYAKLRHLLWLDVGKLARTFLDSEQELVYVKYFTAEISGSLKHDTSEQALHRKEKRNRQISYLGALKACGGIEIIHGRYQSMPRTCIHCKEHYYRHEEKETDVRIATELIKDAVKDKVDVAFLVTGDSDLVPAVRVFRELAPGKTIVAAFPPKRFGNALSNCCHGTRFINKTTLKECQLPASVVCHTKSRKFVLPEQWTQEWLEANT